jgi:hypothetical protein
VPASCLSVALGCATTSTASAERPSPSPFDLADVEAVRIVACSQERAVLITLNRRRRTIAEHINPLRQRFLDVFACRVIELAQSGLPSIDLDHAAASPFRLASKCRDQHSRRAKLYAATEFLLERTLTATAAAYRPSGICSLSSEVPTSPRRVMPSGAGTTQFTRAARSPSAVSKLIGR